MPLFSHHTARFSPDVPLEGTSSRELLKRYQPLETLATGGIGSIEICRDTHLRRRVAIKRIPLINGAGMPASDIMDVLREAHTAAMLQHPNIVQGIEDEIIGLFDNRKHIHYSSEYSKNNHKYNGWCTNSPYKLGKIVI